ncbi:MAG: hypothetical protein Q9170_004176 [Blastenia crenularia]
MATPLVALSCMALIWEALHEHGEQRPRAALISALLINGTINHSSPTDGPGFDYQQGFGRIYINTCIAITTQSTFVKGGNAAESKVPALRLTPDAVRRWTSPVIPVPGSGRNWLVVTLVYPDKGATFLQNDLNLVIRTGDVEKHGNMGSDVGFDHTSKIPCLFNHRELEQTVMVDNVERIVRENVPDTTVNTVVQAYNFLIPAAEQAFAVTWSFRAV